MSEIKVNKYKLVLFVILLLGIFPPCQIGQLNFPILYLASPIFIIIFIYYIFSIKKVPKNISFFIVLWLLIILEIILSGTVQPLIKLGKINIPRDSIQYIERFIFFVVFFFIFYTSKKISEKTFFKYFIIILFLGLLISVFQWIPWPGAPFLAKIYSFKEKYVLTSILEFRRVPGIGGIATANGGFAAFTFVLAFCYYWILRENRKYMVLTMLLAIFIAFIASKARAGQLTIVFAVLVFYIIRMFREKSIIRPTLYLAGSLVLIYLVLKYLYEHNNPLVKQLFNRWNRLFEQAGEGGNRIRQIKFALSQLQNINDYILGISRYVQRKSGFFIEVEPVNILVLFGISGFLLQYSLIFLLLLYLLKNFRTVHQYIPLSALTMAAFVSLLCYQVFSIGYFFFRDTHIGLIPWIFIGSTMGFIEKKKKEIDENRVD